MAYRDERASLRARVDELEAALAVAQDEALRVFAPGRRARIACALLVMGVGAAAALAVRMQRESDARAAGDAWASLSECLLGAPLGANEVPLERLRNVELALAPRREDGGWPWRCAPFAADLDRALRVNDDWRDGANAADELAATLRVGDWDADAAALVDRVATRMREPTFWYHGEARHGADAPPHASPLHLVDLERAKITHAPSRARGERLLGPERHVLFEPDEGAAVLCAVHRATDALTCKPLPGELAARRDLELLGGTDPGAAPLLFGAGQGEAGIFRADTGERVGQGVAASAHAAATGLVRVQVRPPDEAGGYDLLEQAAPGSAVTRTHVHRRKERPGDMAVSRERILWSSGETSSIGSALRRARAHAAWTPPLACQSASGDIQSVEPALDDGPWSWALGLVPAIGERRAGEVKCDGAVPWFVLPDAAKGDRCVSPACGVVTPAAVWSGEGPTSVDVLDETLVMARATPKLGVRARVGTLERIGQAHDVVVFDDLGGGAKIDAIRVERTAHGAFVFLMTRSGVRAVWLTTAGSFQPAVVRR